MLSIIVILCLVLRLYNKKTLQPFKYLKIFMTAVLVIV